MAPSVDPLDVPASVIREALPRLVGEIAGTDRVVFVTVNGERTIALVDAHSVVPLTTSVSEARRDLTNIMAMVQSQDGVAVVTVHDVPKVAIVDARRFDTQGRRKAANAWANELDLRNALLDSQTSSSPVTVNLAGRPKVIVDADEYAELLALKRTLQAKGP